MANRALLLRLREVELIVLTEVVITAFLATIVVSMLGLTSRSRLVVGAAVTVVVAGSFLRRWRDRSSKWQQMVDWAKAPVTWDGSRVAQKTELGLRAGEIDPTEHYTVRWERFGPHRALYAVTQGKERIAVSTLAPNAPTILRDVLHVANFEPCEDWPNLDL